MPEESELIEGKDT